jgi:hypothetical protein
VDFLKGSFEVRSPQSLSTLQARKFRIMPPRFFVSMQEFPAATRTELATYGFTQAYQISAHNLSGKSLRSRYLSETSKKFGTEWMQSASTGMQKCRHCAKTG